MAARAHELVWAAVLLDGCPNVEVLTLGVESNSFWVGGDLVPVIEVDVHAKRPADAELLARALGLGEVHGRVTESVDGDLAVWRTWQGWAPEGSHEAAVWVKVTGADHVTGSAVA